MKWLTIALALALTVATTTPAQAALSQAEQEDVRRLVQSVWDTRAAMNAVKRAVTRGCLTEETRPALHAILTSLHAAQVQHWQALATLLHTSNEQPTGRPELSPAGWHKRAWYYNDRYVTALDATDAKIRLARRACSDNAEYQDDLRKASEASLRSAKTLIQAMNRSLPFAEPYPDLRPGKTIPTVLGPHGDYIKTQWRTNFGKKYMLDSFGHLITWFKDAPLAEVTEKLPPFRDALTQWAGGMDVLDRVTALTAGVTFTPEEAAEDAFCRTLRWRKLATVTAATRIGFFQSFVGAIIGGQLGGVVSKSGDGWRHGWGNLNVWMADIFPENSRCASAFVNE